MFLLLQVLVEDVDKEGAETDRLLPGVDGVAFRVEAMGFFPGGGSQWPF